MSFRKVLLASLLAMTALAGCETSSGGYYEGPVEYRDRPYYRDYDRRPPPIYRGYDRSDRYDRKDRRGYDGPRRGYDGGRRDRDDRRESGRDDRRDEGRRDDRRSERRETAPRRENVVQATPQPAGPPRAYQPPVRGNPGARDSAGQAPNSGRSNAALICSAARPAPDYCKNL